MSNSLLVPIIIFVLVGHVVAGIYFMFRILMKKDDDEAEQK